MRGVCVVVGNIFLLIFSVFFFKHKTAYEMRISDWSSDVCSSDLLRVLRQARLSWFSPLGCPIALCLKGGLRIRRFARPSRPAEIGRASCRERVCQYV